MFRTITKLTFSFTRYSQSLAVNDSIYTEKDESVYDWTPQRGYVDNKDADKIIPRRSNGNAEGLAAKGWLHSEPGVSS
nr:unnamed protein product [Callosobruchus analis]